MNEKILNDEISDIKNDYIKYFSQKDEQAFFYFMQMIELFYNELSPEVYDKEFLYDLICNEFKSDVNLIFSNMKDYFLNLANNSVEGFNEIIRISVNNKYINANNLSNMYANFKNEITSNTKLKDKIQVIVSTYSAKLMDKLYSTCVLNSNKPKTIIDKYTKILIEELTKNITEKSDFLLSSYKSFVDGITEEIIGDRAKINELNSKVISNATYVYLKEQEYFVINKYVDESFKNINTAFETFEDKIRGMGIKMQERGDLNSTRDYFLGFNNTIGVKIKNIFDEMNLAVTMDTNDVTKKVKEFNDIITHIYEINLKFDKQFAAYKKAFVLNARNHEKFEEAYSVHKEKVLEILKINISNIFRENIKFYNDVVYKCLGLKSRLDDFTLVLSEEEVRSLLTN